MKFSRWRLLDFIGDYFVIRKTKRSPICVQSTILTHTSSLAKAARSCILGEIQDSEGGVFVSISPILPGSRLFSF